MPARLFLVSALLITIVLRPLQAGNPIVVIETSLGRVTLELYPEKAPKTVENFLAYVDSEHFNGTIFHRVFSQILVQGGGFTSGLKEKPTRAAIPNEADNGMKNLRGTIAMARTSSPHSARSQFFINLIDNPNLDHKAKTEAGWGYTVFGRVIDGLPIVESISDVPTSSKGGHRNLPILPVTIDRVRVR